MAPDARNLLQTVFESLNQKIEVLNQEARDEGFIPIPQVKVQLLGQISLMVNDQVSSILSLTQTGDLDAFVTMDHTVKNEFKKLLIQNGLVYDEDSYLIWVPPSARFEPLFKWDHLVVETLDPESALVSKAVKAPQKNKLLIREAIASGEFPTLVERILKNGGKLEDFT